jgi:hypothetical protein
MRLGRFHAYDSTGVCGQGLMFSIRSPALYAGLLTYGDIGQAEWAQAGAAAVAIPSLPAIDEMEMCS